MEGEGLLSAEQTKCSGKNNWQEWSNNSLHMQDSWADLDSGVNIYSTEAEAKANPENN